MLQLILPTLVATLVYTGRMYGVHSKVCISDGFRVATVTLKGPGVDHVGQGRLARNGSIELDDVFACYLRRRRVALRRVDVAPSRDSISITVDLPLFGTRDLVLRRSHEPSLPGHFGRCE